MKEEEIDLTSFGEGWVNTALDFKQVANSIPETHPYAMLYLWDVSKGDGKDITGMEWRGEYIEGFAFAFYRAFKHNMELIPLITLAISRFIKEEEDPKKRKGYQKEILKILNFDNGQD